MERKPLKASLKCGDRIRFPMGHVENEFGVKIRDLYQEIVVSAGSCVVEIRGFWKAEIVRGGANSSGKVKTESSE